MTMNEEQLFNCAWMAQLLANTIKKDLNQSDLSQQVTEPTVSILDDSFLEENRHLFQGEVELDPYVITFDYELVQGDLKTEATLTVVTGNPADVILLDDMPIAMLVQAEDGYISTMANNQLIEQLAEDNDELRDDLNELVDLLSDTVISVLYHEV